MMASVIVLGQTPCKTIIDVQRVIREMLSRVTAYERRVAPLAEIRTTVLPSMMFGLMDLETRKCVEQKGAVSEIMKMKDAVGKLCRMQESIQKPMIM